MSVGAKVAIGAGVAAVGAGAYYFMGPDGKKHQKKAKAFAGKMEKEVMANMKKMKALGLPVYEEVVDAVAQKYSKEYKEHSADVLALAKNLKSKWASAEKSAKSTVNKAKKAVKKATKTSRK